MFSAALRREISALLFLKVVALFVLYQIFFASAQPDPDSGATRTHILASVIAKEP